MAHEIPHVCHQPELLLVLELPRLPVHEVRTAQTEVHIRVIPEMHHVTRWLWTSCSGCIAPALPALVPATCPLDARTLPVPHSR